MTLICAKLAPPSTFGPSVPNQRQDYSVNGRFSQYLTVVGIAFIIKCMSSAMVFHRVLSQKKRKNLQKSGENIKQRYPTEKFHPILYIVAHQPKVFSNTSHAMKMHHSSVTL